MIAWCFCDKNAKEPSFPQEKRGVALALAVESPLFMG